MKYANIKWQETIRGNQAAINYGDNLQFLAIDGLYKDMKIIDVRYLDMHEIASYRGEKLILPLNWTIFDANYMDGDYLIISPDIEPVFLGMALCGRDDDRFFNQENINYLKEHGPIGCRDEYTYQKLNKYGIKAYINGCISITLSRQKSGGEKVILVDAPIELERDIQKNLGTEFQCMTQQIYMGIEEAKMTLPQVVRKHYKYIKENAKIVVTSRLHVASPCIAMGIPVIFARNEVDYRFSWLDKFIKLYSKEEFGDIDWKPQTFMYEDMKQNIRQNDMERILGKQTDCENQKIHNYFADRERHVYGSFQKSIADIERIKEYICKNWKGKKEVEYVLWGLNDTAQDLFFYIAQNFPDAKLVGIIDDYRQDSFAGMQCEKHTKLHVDEESYILVTAVAASNVAYSYFKSRKRLFLLGDVFINWIVSE